MGYQTPSDAAEPVAFRREKDGDITAVFPATPGTTDPSTMTCFAHVGQHSSCTMEWYYTTKPAKPEEYTDLKHELESKPYSYRLHVVKRITQAHHQMRYDELKRYK